MDRNNRLTQIKESDLSESRLNEEFLTWLKTKGLNWLLLVLILLLGWLGWNIWHQRRQESRDAAWTELVAANLPVSYLEVATRHAGIDAVPVLAHLSAGDRYLSSVQSGVRFDRTTDQPDYRLDPSSRAEFLDAADASYRSAIAAVESLGPDPNGTRAPMLMSAYFGRAAVAECRGELDAAKAFLEKGREIAGDRFPAVVAWSNRRIEELPGLATAAAIPSQASLPARETLTPLSPAIADDLLRDLMNPPVPPAAPEGATAPATEAPASEAPAAPSTPDPAAPAPEAPASPSEPDAPATPPGA